MTGERDGACMRRTVPTAILFAFTASLLFCATTPAFAVGDGTAQRTEAAPKSVAVPVGTFTLPATLSDQDASTYTAIFALQDQAQWDAADHRIATLGDKALLGTVLAQRLTSPRYRGSFAEYKAWLEQYPDHPDARTVWTLARKKAPNQAVPSPVMAAVSTNEGASAPVSRLPNEPKSAGLRTPPRYAAGLAHWRAGRFADAVVDFEAVARGGTTPGWYVAAAAYWAARAHVKLRHAEEADTWLVLAADEPRSFYGMLARQKLGLDVAVKQTEQGLTPLEVSQLQSLPASRRALALVQIGESDRAEAELRALISRGNRTLSQAIVALADLVHMPALCMAIGSKDAGEARRDAVLYPMPRWQPRNGFQVDRALLFALMMQESRFTVNAQSSAGASGLMQLMPDTARAVARKAGIAFRSMNDLVDPALNLSLGQEYVKLLIDHEQINGNLILLLASYNTGPGAIAKWPTIKDYAQDPLLFIESLPNQDVRLYVEQVMTNLWIYRERLGQSVPDLEALASNSWPSYVALDRNTKMIGVQSAQAR